MEIVIQPDYARLCDAAASLVLSEVARRPNLVLGLATGKTPLGVYERLRKSTDAFRKVRFFNLDEFFGQSPSSPGSFHRQLRESFIDQVAHDPANVHLLRGDVADLEAASLEYEASIRDAGGIDVQILGIGKNGHIGFNEPGSSLGSRTRPKTLEPETLADYFGSPGAAPPSTRFAVTMGIGTIMEARRLVLLAAGAEKAEVIRRAAEGPITAEVPASVIQFHPYATVVLDEAAASKLKRRDHYKWVYENKYRVGQ